MFSVGQRVFYPGHGVAEIAEVLERVVAGSQVKFYKLSFVYKDMTVMLPFNGMETSGVRHVSSGEDVLAAYTLLGERPEKERSAFDLAPTAWTRRQREYQMKIQGGGLSDMVMVYRDLMLLTFRKDLSFGEKGILELVEDLIAQDISCGVPCEREEVVERLRKPFGSVEGGFVDGVASVHEVAH